MLEIAGGFFLFWQVVTTVADRNNIGTRSFRPLTNSQNKSTVNIMHITFAVNLRSAVALRVECWTAKQALRIRIPATGIPMDFL